MPQAIQLERTGMPSDSNFRVAFWLDVPAARQSLYADAAKTSVFKLITAPELAAIRSGAVLEVVETVEKPASGTVAEFRNDVEARLARLQQELINRNPWARYGTRFDGTTWTPVTVA